MCGVWTAGSAVWIPSAPAAELPVLSFKDVKIVYNTVLSPPPPHTHTLVLAKLSAFKYLYLFVWDSINIYEHIVTVLYILSSLKAMYAVNVLVFRMGNNKN